MPLVGHTQTDTPDPFHHIRLMMGSQKGTLMEVGLSPIMYSSLFMMVIMAVFEALEDSVSDFCKEDM